MVQGAVGEARLACDRAVVVPCESSNTRSETERRGWAGRLAQSALVSAAYSARPDHSKVRGRGNATCALQPKEAVCGKMRESAPLPCDLAGKAINYLTFPHNTCTPAVDMEYIPECSGVYRIGVAATRLQLTIDNRRLRDLSTPCGYSTCIVREGCCTHCSVSELHGGAWKHKRELARHALTHNGQVSATFSHDPVWCKVVLPSVSGMTR